ncbi:hypothetical protein ABZP36_030991 [Zizania latifolia]
MKHPVKNAGVVAKDVGSGDYNTMGEAAPDSGNSRYVIHVKSSTYPEKVEVRRKNVMLVGGDGVGRRTITGGNLYCCKHDRHARKATANSWRAARTQWRTGEEEAGRGCLLSSSDCSVFFLREVRRGFRDTVLAEAGDQIPAGRPAAARSGFVGGAAMCPHTRISPE